MIIMQTTSNTPLAKKAGTNKLILGFAAVLASAVVGTTGLAAAKSLSNNDKPTKAQCAAAGFKNYGQCVKLWAQAQGAGYGGGYGGNVNASTNVSTSTNVDLALSNSDHNVITIVFNLFRKI